MQHTLEHPQRIRTIEAVQWAEEVCAEYETEWKTERKGKIHPPRYYCLPEPTPSRPESELIGAY
jgi:hypothetical protein